MKRHWRLRDADVLVGVGGTSTSSHTSFFSAETGNYTCEFCGKQYKYYTPYQEHVALHAPISESLLQLGDGESWGGAGVSH